MLRPISRLLPLAALLVLALAPAAAHATYPGVNGPKILFTRCPGGSACGAGYQLLTANPDGSAPTQFVISPPSFTTLDASYSADGTRTAYSDCPSSLNSCFIETNNAAGTAPHPLAAADPNIVDDYPVFSPDGSKIAFMRDQSTGCPSACTTPTYSLMIMGADGSSPVPLTSDVRQTLVDMEVSFSPDGSKIVYENDAKGLSVIAVGGGTPVTYDTVSPGLEDTSPDWSPDGSKIVFSHGSGINWRIYAMAATPGSTPAPLGADPGPDNADYEPSYSPDGTKILFDRADSLGNVPIWVMNADGSSPTRVTAADAYDFRPVWQPGHPASPPPPPAPKPPFGGVALVGSTFTVGSNGVVEITQSCPAAAQGSCAGTLTLKTAGAVAAQSAKKKHRKPKKHRRVLTLGKATFSIPAGTTAKLKVRISKAGLAVLRANKRLSAVALVTSKDGSGVAKSSSTRLTLKAAKQRKHHKKKHGR